jgi:hypothetical protein
MAEEGYFGEVIRLRKFSDDLTAGTAWRKFMSRANYRQARNFHQWPFSRDCMEYGISFRAYG